MKLLLPVTLLAALVSVAGARAQAADDDVKAILDKAIKAVGGSEKLEKAAVLQWKTKGVFIFGGNESEFNGKSTFDGLEKLNSEFEADFGGTAVKAVTVVNGKEGWRMFGGMTMPMDDVTLANEKRLVALQVIPITLVALKGKEFKLASAPEAKVGDKPAAGVKVTDAAGKDFTMYFDKDTGLPVRTVAKVLGFMGEEFVQETNFIDYKEVAGIKKATKIEIRREGETFLKQEILDFKSLDKVPADTFAEPK